MLWHSCDTCLPYELKATLLAGSALCLWDRLPPGGCLSPTQLQLPCEWMEGRGALLLPAPPARHHRLLLGLHLLLLPLARLGGLALALLHRLRLGLLLHPPSDISGCSGHRAQPHAGSRRAGRHPRL
jgi:hypothetical protein